MGVKAVRMSRKFHPMPIMSEAKDRAASEYSDGQRPPKSVAAYEKDSPVPKKTWPNADKYPTTPPPKANVAGLDGEGRPRGRQADKSSRSK